MSTLIVAFKEISVCPWFFILECKSRRDWEETVADMRLLAREELKKDWFTHHESKIIVDLLVKTQGLESVDSLASKKEVGNESQKDSKQ